MTVMKIVVEGGPDGITDLILNFALAVDARGRSAHWDTVEEDYEPPVAEVR